jgi:hypothetical protein
MDSKFIIKSHFFISWKGKKRQSICIIIPIDSISRRRKRYFKELRDSGTINEHPDIVIPGTECHSLCYNVLAKWQKAEEELGITNDRREYFTVSKTRYIRQDGYGDGAWIMPSNTHGTIEIKFRDNVTAQLDNGWFGALGPAGLQGNFIFGESNIPSNYTRVYDTLDSIYWNL